MLLKRILSYINKKGFSDKFIKSDYIIDKYRGVRISIEESDLLKINDMQEIDERINNSINDFKKNNIRSVLIKIPSDYSHLIQYFIKRNFNFHHTKDNNLFLNTWLEENTSDKLPKYAEHQVGIAALILNTNLELLLIKDAYSFSSKTKAPSPWKFVTGLIDGSESLIEATKREAKEECNLDIEYHGLINIMETLDSSYGCTDICLFNICSVNDISKLKIQPDELKEAKFFNYREVKDLIKEGKATTMTEFTFNKAASMIDFDKSLDENINNLKENKAMFKPNDEIKIKLNKKFSLFI